MTRFVTIRGPADREQARALIDGAPLGSRVEFHDAKRSPDQNSLMWVRLNIIAERVDWPVAGHLQKLTPTDWKDIFTAGLRRAIIVPNSDGNGFVQLGLHTSGLSKDEMSQLLDLIDAFAAERGVDFGEQQDSAEPPQPDAPAALTSPQPQAAGAPIHAEASLLSDDWRNVYLTTMTGPTTRAMSIQTRDTTALQMMGGMPNAAEREWMRQVATLTNRRDKGKLKSGEFEAEVKRLRDVSIADLANVEAA